MLSRFLLPSFALRLWVAMILAWAAAPSLAAPPPSEQAAAVARVPHGEAYAQRLAPLIKTHCVDCHSGEAPDGQLSLSKFTTLESVVADPKVWRKVLKKVSSGEMPPPDAEPLSVAQRDKLTSWLRGMFTAIESQAKPRRVTMRRLNRAEYANTIRDLLGLEFQGSRDFPADGVGYGFDNNGDVLSLSPLLLEKYLAAAQQITDEALPPPAQPAPHFRYKANHLLQSGGYSLSGPNGRYAILGGVGWVGADHDFATAGRYELRISAYGSRGGNVWPRMVISSGGAELRQVDVSWDTPRNYSIEFDAPPGKRRLQVAFINDYYDLNDPDPTNRDRNLAVGYLDVRGPLPPRAALSPAGQRLIPQRPSENLDAETAARQALGPLAERAFRRPLAPAELERLMRIWRLADENGEPFERSIAVATQAVLVSPNFLFRAEPAAPQAGNASGPEAVDDFALASRLSYFLWSSMPDEELFELARRGELRKPEVLRQQALRMLRDPKVNQGLCENFVSQWLEIKRLAQMRPDPTEFPDFDESLRAAMGEEPRRFFAHVVKQDRPALELVDADYTFLNERLAKHYGIYGVVGAEFREVDLRPMWQRSQRGGVLTMAGVLTVTSNPTRTSPVKRGKWVLDNLLGSPPPAAPPEIPALAEGKKAAATGTLRQRMEQHRANPSCASCHSRMDPLGFGLENYDAIGRWRLDDGHFAIDSAGALPGAGAFAGPAELKRVLLADPEVFVRSLSDRLLTYALGRGLEYEDERVLDQITTRLAGREPRFSELVTAVVTSDPFRLRERTTASSVTAGVQP